ncbi:hypothetical protein RvY_01635 [Ramazzottius varieornatus]|uniref:Uncharacterized protein n=1 Tax=Ramazzottius varieornatus TaxID=947166 RepID=A0A1D1UP34_RAMVA|nr:hypothetical protein RvY_01635 [Ramazzottius varieornatus]
MYRSATIGCRHVKCWEHLFGQDIATSGQGVMPILRRHFNLIVHTLVTWPKMQSRQSRAQDS